MIIITNMITSTKITGDGDMMIEERGMNAELLIIRLLEKLLELLESVFSIKFF